MIGLILEYSTENTYKLAKLNHILFGRIIKTKSRDETVYYYQKGILHDIKYKKLLNGKYFIHNVKIKKDLKIILKEYCKWFKLREDVRIFTEGQLETSKEHWLLHASERGYKVRKWI